MSLTKLLSFLVSIFFAGALLFESTGCEKEYSYEGGDTATVIITRDSLPATDSLPSSSPIAAIEFPVCSFCHASDDLALGSWSFNVGNSYLCGAATNPGFIGGYSRTDFTVFGPSACSTDTGIVLSVYLPIPLNEDRYNITTTASAFYYYDNTATKDILISQELVPFSVTVQSFIAATSIATGTFSGTVFKANGDTAFITNGKFKVKLK